METEKKVDQKAYLQKYLSGPRDKKKKKKKIPKGKGLKIIDDDIDISLLRSLDGDQMDVFGEGEDAPVIAGIIDERPPELRAAEEFTTAKWKVITQDDGFDSKVKIEEYRSKTKKQPETGLYFGKMYSDSEDEKKNDSPPRKLTASTDEPKVVRKESGGSGAIRKKLHNARAPSNDSDLSPPRIYESKSTKDTRKPTRDKGSDSDISPPRTHESRSNDRRKPSRWNKHDERHSDRVDSTHRNQREREERTNENSDISPVRRKSPERSTRKESEHSSRSMPNMAKKRRNENSDSDLSPERNSSKHLRNSQNDSYSNKDTSRYNDFRQRPTKESYSSNRDRDLSHKDNDRYNERRTDASNRHTSYRRNSDSPPPSNRKMERTLEGKKAGLQDARGLREENREFKRREEEMFRNMSAEASGRNAATISRKREKRETSAEREKKRIDQEKRKELEEKYRRWGKGLKQVERQEQNVADFLHEASKPLARLRGDEDMERALKHQERKGDPMLAYMREKKRESRGIVAERPKYQGDFPPNRFNITPGYRWDGVDRSNGYERKYFEHRSKLKALQEEAYKWSTEDL